MKEYTDGYYRENHRQQEVIDACDGCIEIPQYGTKHSLNVSVTTGIVLWEFANKLIKFRKE